MLKLAVPLIALALAACVSTVPYQQQPARFSREQAVAIVRQGFEEQPKELRPLTVSVDADALRLVDQALYTSGPPVGGSMAPLQSADTLYYSNIGDVTFDERNGALHLNCRIVLRNRERTFQRTVLFAERSRGVDFLDALYRLAATD